MDFKTSTDTAGLNHALYEVTHGLYVLTSRSERKIDGQCLDSLMQITNVPPRIAIGVGKTHLTHDMIEESGIFIVNVIDKDNPNWDQKIQHFGFLTGRKVDKFTSEIAYELGELGAPVLSDAKAFYECKVDKKWTQDLGTHTLYIGDVIRAGVHEQGEPLTYNYYRKVKK